jgi:hypothetical protein
LKSLMQCQSLKQIEKADHKPAFVEDNGFEPMTPTLPA